MLILLAVIAIGLIGGVFASYLRNTQNNIGGGIGKNYMVAYWQKGHLNPDGFESELPSVMDFPLRDAVNGALHLPLASEVNAVSEREGRRKQGDMKSVYSTIARDFQYSDLNKVLLFWSNHDTARIGDVFGGSYDKMKLAFAMLATMRGMPQMFYGDELMFTIGTSRRDDGRLRMDFPGGWEGDSIDLFSEGGRRCDVHAQDLQG